MFTEVVARGSGQFVDALSWPHGIERYVGLVVPTWSRSDIRARIVEVDRSATGSAVLTLRPNRRWRGFRAGQYTQVSVEVDGVRHTRCYSVSSSAHRSGTIELGVRAHAEGRVSRYLVERAGVGDVLTLTPAAGDFVLPEQRPDRLLLVSGGSGITPVLSMLRTLCDEGHDRPVTFLHYALERDAMIARTEIEALAARHHNVRLVQVFTDEPGTGDLDGFLTVDHLDAADPAWTEADAYVCGPAPLMEAARDCFEAVGRGHRMHTEAFTLPHLVAEAGASGTIRFAAGGTEVPSDGRPLLAQAEDCGLRPASGCRMGICHTCIRPLRRGTVRDVVSGEITTVSTTPVDVRICVSVPIGDVDIDL